MLTIAPLIASVVAVVTAVLAFGTSRQAHALSVRTAAQTDRRGRSEETMRLLRWAVELAVEEHPRRFRAGMATLDALTRARLVVSGDRAFVEAVTRALAVDLADPLTYSQDEGYYRTPRTGDQGG
jgi:hypothetical protein